MHVAAISTTANGWHRTLVQVAGKDPRFTELIWRTQRARHCGRLIPVAGPHAIPAYYDWGKEEFVGLIAACPICGRLYRARLKARPAYEIDEAVDILVLESAYRGVEPRKERISAAVQEVFAGGLTLPQPHRRIVLSVEEVQRLVGCLGR